MTRAELAKLTEIRDGLKDAYWDFEKWRWAMKFDQFILDAAHEINQADAARDGAEAASAGANHD